MRLERVAAGNVIKARGPLAVGRGDRGQGRRRVFLPHLPCRRLAARKQGGASATATSAIRTAAVAAPRRCLYAPDLAVAPLLDKVNPPLIVNVTIDWDCADGVAFSAPATGPVTLTRKR